MTYHLYLEDGPWQGCTVLREHPKTFELLPDYGPDKRLRHKYRFRKQHKHDTLAVLIYRYENPVTDYTTEA